MTAVPESIVCGVDGSQDSREALRVARGLADRLGLRLIAAHVVAPPTAVGSASLGGVPAVAPPLEQAGLRLLERVVDEERAPRAERRVELGLPPERLADLADEERAALIVVGSRGRGRLATAFLGSVSGDLIGLARCPVLVVPRGAHGAEPSTPGV